MWTHISPAARLIANFVAMIAVVLVNDPYTPAMFLVVSIGLTLRTGVLTGRGSLRLIPFLCFAFAMFWMNAAWANVTDATVVASLGPLHFTDQGVMIGLALALRIMAVGLLTLVFLGTMDPTDMVLSLVQQFRFPPRLAYSLMAALRFVPTLETEMQLVRAAHRIRGAGVDGRLAWIKRAYRYAIPLLAGGIRRAERVAIAMEARGFTGDRDRTYMRQLPWMLRDTMFVIISLGVVIAIFVISARFGWLTWAWFGGRAY